MNMAIHSINLMCDTETLGAKPGCGVLSIALVPFQAFGLPAPIENFYVRISPESSALAGLRTEESTMKWWSRQSLEARTEAFNGTVSLSEALYQLQEYMGTMPEDALIWGKGASFDIPIIEAAYAAFKRPTPWNYKQSMCFRTLETLYPQVPAPFKNTMKHNALGDAIYQAAHAQRILEWLTRA